MLVEVRLPPHPTDHLRSNDAIVEHIQGLFSNHRYRKASSNRRIALETTATAGLLTEDFVRPLHRFKGPEWIVMTLIPSHTFGQTTGMRGRNKRLHPSDQAVAVLPSP